MKHKCRYRLTSCPFINNCDTCTEPEYNPNAKFSEDDLAVHGLKDVFKVGDIIPDNIEDYKQELL
jgi:hypothetical protein